jgi:hypothetical protein
MCELPDAFQSTTRKARKEHRCCECRVAIKPGDEYRYSSGIWVGEPNSHKQCMTCHEVFMWATNEAEYDDEAPAFGYLNDWLDNYRVYGQSKEDWLNDIAQQTQIEPGKLRRLLRMPQ